MFVCVVFVYCNNTFGWWFVCCNTFWCCFQVVVMGGASRHVGRTLDYFTCVFGFGYKFGSML